VPTRLTQKLAWLAVVVGSADAAPTRQAQQVFTEVSGALDAQLSRLATMVKDDLPAFDAMLRRLEIPAVG
jgi:hypothetical protein